MGNTIRQEHKYHNVSHGFKIAMVALLFFLILIRLGLLLYLPKEDVLPDEMLLAVFLFIVSYLWFRERKDYHSLLVLTRDLDAAYSALKRAHIDTITALIKAEEEKDLYTKGHSERVKTISLVIAEEMHLDKESKKIIARSGILHDIGKIGIADAILNKKEKLTDAEWEIIKSHPEKAIHILEPLKFLVAEKKAILNHHERYDGKGYPSGHKGKEICHEALILAVADAFDAMNSKRAYRDPLSRESIITILRQCRGTQHSAEVVDTFLKLLEKSPELWEK